MSDLISRQDVIEKINERARETFSLAPGYEHYLGALHDVANDLEQIPTVDAVPVVRCKGCRNWERLLLDKDGECYCPFVDHYTTGDWYCADGERKDNE